MTLLTIDEIYNRLAAIDWLLNDYFISWYSSKKLLEEKALLEKKLQELNMNFEK